jgi:acetyltransferase-like isoleucine patch superfamily enzyme
MTDLKRFLLHILMSVKIKKHGKNNSVQISNSAHLRKVKIKIYGSNNSVIIRDNTYLHNVYLRIGFKDCFVNNCLIQIGNNTSFNSADIQLGEDNSKIIIGEDNMFSFGIEIACTDTHSVTDFSGKLINYGKEIIIGNHNWICKKVSIMKNSKIPNNCVIAQNSLITSKFTQDNTVIAGIPARVVKENINWHRKRPCQYQNNENI